MMSTIMDRMIDDIALNAMSWVREAGALLLKYFRGDDLDIHTKLNDSDIVTAADKASEALLISHIRECYPSHAILSEESGATDGDSGWRWVIDPLDGTTNFGSGLPVYAVSIGVEYKGETVIGVVYAPYLNEFFHAVKGQGAFLNGKPLKPSATDSLSRAVVATGFPVDKNVTSENNLDNLERVMPMVRGIRRLGSAATEICYVAAGFLDAHWELNLHRWDVSAALLIADEAGARHRFFRDDRNISVVTASPQIFPLIDPLLSESARK